MGIVAKQSARNTVILITGLLLGAINTMFVLPKAFEGFEEGWGLIRIMTAWGTILAQILALGTPSAIIRFLPTAENKDRESSMLTLLCMLPAVAFAMVGVASSSPRCDEAFFLVEDLRNGKISGCDAHCRIGPHDILTSWIMWNVSC